MTDKLKPCPKCGCELQLLTAMADTMTVICRNFKVIAGKEVYNKDGEHCSYLDYIYFSDIDFFKDVFIEHYNGLENTPIKRN